MGYSMKKKSLLISGVWLLLSERRLQNGGGGFRVMGQRRSHSMSPARPEGPVHYVALPTSVIQFKGPLCCQDSALPPCSTFVSHSALLFHFFSLLRSRRALGNANWEMPIESEWIENTIWLRALIWIVLGWHVLKGNTALWCLIKFGHWFAQDKVLRFFKYILEGSLDYDSVVHLVANQKVIYLWKPVSYAYLFCPNMTSLWTY